ncbi:MAG: hypothetical protein H7Y86_16510, partial [Rhizobacter sp.]|nr:hypothetical protein [Ferruginibacter sp.]
SIWNGMVKAAAGVNNVKVTLPLMSAGIYYLRYDDGKTQQVLKMMKQ